MCGSLLLSACGQRVTLDGTASDLRLSAPVPVDQVVAERVRPDAAGTETETIPGGLLRPAPQGVGDAYRLSFHLRGLRPGARLTGGVPGVRAALATGSPGWLTLDWPAAWPTRVAYDGRAVTVSQTRRGDRRSTRTIAPGVALETGARFSVDGAWRYHLLRLSPGAARRLDVRPAGRTNGERQPVPKLAANDLAGINGGFFDLDSGVPLGALKVGGEWAAMPLLGRTALLLPPDGPPRIAAVTWRGTVTTGGVSLPIDAFNRTPGDDARCAVTSARWAGAASFPGWVATRAPGGLTVHTRTPLPGPPRVRLAGEPDVDGSILGAGPRLMEGGRVRVTKAEERFRPDITEGRTARAGVALTAAGEMLLGVVDGRAPQSSGMTLEEWAALLRDEGGVEAMGLDGHTMATLVVAGRLVSTPTNGAPQPVADALVVRRP